jgi:hypothetical protein
MDLFFVAALGWGRVLTPATSATRLVVSPASAPSTSTSTTSPNSSTRSQRARCRP